MDEKIRIGISTCLLGEKVRYDGGHKRDGFLVDTLGTYFDYVPVCPEVECGLPVPREAMRLVGDPSNPRLLTQKTGIDHTDRMHRWGTKRLDALERDDLCGYVFKSKSPSSGMERVKVYGPSGQAAKKGVGIWARMFMGRFPVLPVEEEGRLHDAALRENFIERVFVMHRWRAVDSGRKSLGALVDFHTRHKLLLMAHDVETYRALGKLVAEGKKKDRNELFAGYAAALFGALKKRATPRKHHNVLLHAMGFFKKQLSPDEKQELLEVFGHYKSGSVPLIVPITLLNHYTRKYGQPYLEEQIYLHPHPI
jgi:uncharacterized protein YbgA (DUF1722 family)/uncharacterized protein YbbK (DUF523 family)